MRFEVPQFIEIEDKIFGPLTWRQFLYLGGGVGIAIATFFINKILFLFVGLPIAVLAGALSFYPVNNRPFSYFLEAFVGYVTGPKTYLWRKKENIIYSAPEANTPVSTTAPQPVVRTTGKNISSLARKLELQAIQKEQ